MYDRKTWFVVIACSVVLGLNVYYNSKNAKAIADSQAAAPATATAPADPSAIPAAAPAALTVEPVAPPAEEKLVTLETSKVEFTLSTVGGGIKYADLKEQFQVGSKTDRIRLNAKGAGPIGGIAGPDKTPQNISYAYDEAASVAGKSVVFVGTHDGLTIRKTFTVLETDAPGSGYLLGFDLQIENASAAPVGLDGYSLFLGEAYPELTKEKVMPSYFWHLDGEIDFHDVGEFKGGMMSSAKSMTSHEGEKLEYGGVADQFFATLIRPKEVQPGKLWFKPAKEYGAIEGGINFPTVTLAAGEKKALAYTTFAGPRHNAMLRQMGGNWSDIMPYGMVGWVANPLNRLLNGLHHAFEGTGPKWAWGLAIIAMTLIVRTLIWPLYAKSARSMKRMSKLQPEMAKLKEKYSDDPNKMNQEMMKLYRTYGVNPLGGCLPMLIQLPVFYGFFRVLQYAVELRGQGFLWVDDLSQPDTEWVIPIFGGVPINPLPIVMALTSFWQMALTPKTGDKTQQRIMMMMPFLFFFFCYNFAAALALYWTTTNLFSIMQTWITNKMPEPELKEKKRTPGKKTFMERMVEKQQEMEKAQRMRQEGGDPSKMIDVTKKRRTPRTGG
jgi:YidC/Oxa1 family membrane protein insertase